MRRTTLAAMAGVLLALPLGAQVPQALATWIHLDAVPGTEAPTAKRLQGAFAGWRTDAWGNLIKTQGSGAPHRVVACALDYSAFVVSRITDDGYLRLRRTGVPTHPLWSQFMEAQRVAIQTANGRVPGVVAVFNGHFARQHVGDTAVTGVDQLWVDIGASSKREVERLGIALLDPVMPARPQWSYASYAAGPGAGARAGCAAVASAAANAPSSGQTTFVMSTQRVFGWVGLSAALSRLGRIDRLAIVEAGRATRSVATVSSARLPQSLRALAGHVSADSTSVYVPAVLWNGSTVESIDSTEARAMLAWVAAQGGVTTPSAFVHVPGDTARKLTPRVDAFGALEKQFMTLVDLPGVSAHERPVRDAVLAALPQWARGMASVDTAGNIVVSAGPDRDAMAIIAHTDEVGFEVDRILGDGRLVLRTRGGVVLPSWESTPALLHFDEPGKAPLRGVFIPRDSARLRTPTSVQAWFGMDSAQLVAAGVRPRLSLTSYKRAERLAGTRITARGSDDRTGSTALLTAVASIDPARLKRRVYFVWTTREEGGLEGARAFAAEHGATLTRVYAVDTFVSSDTPLESKHFAFAPLGQGAVLRGLDDGTYAPRAERERVLRIAKANGIPLQPGTTQGSTDGSAVSPYGPPNLGLSWPGRYSHGPAEVLDLRDVQALARLVAALAVAP